MKKPETGAQKLKKTLLIFAGFFMAMCALGGLVLNLSDIGTAARKFESNRKRFRQLGLPETPNAYLSSIQVDPALNAGPELKALFDSAENQALIIGLSKELFQSSPGSATSTKFKPTTVSDADWAKFKPIMSHLEGIVKKPYCVIPQDWSRPPFTYPPEYAYAKSLVKALSARAFTELQQSDVSEALRELNIAARISKWQDSDGTIISNLVRVATATMIERQIALMLESPNANREFVAGLKPVLDELGTPINLYKTIRAEAMLGIALLDEASRDGLRSFIFTYGGESPPLQENGYRLGSRIPLVRQGWHSRLLELYIAGAENAPSNAEDYEQWEKAFDLMDQIVAKTDPSYAVTSYAVPNSVETVQAIQKERSQLHVLIQARQSRETYLQTGQYPRSLPVAGKSAIDTIVSPAMLKLDITHGFKVWSVGKNKVDDKGLWNYSTSGTIKPKDDFAVTLP